LYAGRWNKARKGLLRFALPVGYVRGADGTWELDPDTQVRARLDYVFAAFRREGVARAVVRALRTEQLDLPVRLTSKDGYGALRWKAPTLSGVLRILANPAYAGAYVYGRWDYTGPRRSAATGKVLPKPRPREDWSVCLHEHHPAYLSWAEFVQNQERLRANWQHDGHPGVPRDGTALLQGIVQCGLCGRTMGVQYHAHREHRAPTYLCDRGYREGDARICQSMSTQPVDAAVAAAFLEAVAPLSLEVSVRVLDRLEQDLAAQR
jgi:hypothetical protein